VFEDFGFGSLLATPAPPLALAAWAAEARAAPGAGAAGLVVDAGFSFMHAAPVLGGRVLAAAVRRVNVGGKALTNHLKELACRTGARARSPGCPRPPMHAAGRGQARGRTRQARQQQPGTANRQGAAGSLGYARLG